jgi:tetratricopeptide (TPR) repeat protein
MRPLRFIFLPVYCVFCLAVASAWAADGELDALIQRAREAMRARDYATAIEQLNSATQKFPQEADAWFRLGLAYAADGQVDASIAAYERTAELDPEQAKARNNIANAHFRRGEYGTALSWYEQALAIQPDYLLAQFHRGWVLRQFSRHEEAERSFRQCLEQRPKNDRERATQFDCLFYYGALRFRAEDWAAAAEVMEQVVGMNNSHIEARYYLGMAYRRLGRTEEARRQLDIHRQMLRASRRDDTIKKDKP